MIPKDTIIIPDVWTAHRDPKVFGERVDEFVPERFLDEEGNLKRKDPTIGFGAGNTVSCNCKIAFNLKSFLREKTVHRRDFRTPELVLNDHRNPAVVQRGISERQESRYGQFKPGREPFHTQQPNQVSTKR